MKSLKCIKSIPVEEGLPVNFFTEGRIYEITNVLEHVFRVKDNFKQEQRLITSPWFDEHFVLTEKVPTVYESKTVNVWTNGNAIRKYTGQDHHEDYNHKKRNGKWYKATAVITRVIEEEEV
jgi:hypothetical protein